MTLTINFHQMSRLGIYRRTSTPLMYAIMIVACFTEAVELFQVTLVLARTSEEN